MGSPMSLQPGCWQLCLTGTTPGPANVSVHPLAYCLHLEAQPTQLIMVEDLTSVKNKSRLHHACVDAGVVQGLDIWGKRK